MIEETPNYYYCDNGTSLTKSYKANRFRMEKILLKKEIQELDQIFEPEVYRQRFPDKILENKRVYYDDIYDQDDSISYIKDVHFERKNDNYLSGLEYLSSIILLSRCTALVGGNCGGTLGALFFNDEKYEFVHVFNLGLYP